MPASQPRWMLEDCTGGRFRVHLNADLRNILALPMEPQEAEPQLRQGNWLVLAVAVWSQPDLRAIDDAIALAQHLEGKCLVAVRPFDDVREFAKWCPELANEHGSPIWIAIKDGSFQRKLVGLYSRGAIEKLAYDVFV
jgi:hypothetical protein